MQDLAEDVAVDSRENELIEDEELQVIYMECISFLMACIMCRQDILISSSHRTD